MEGFLLLVFATLAALTALLELFKRSGSKEDPADRAFLRFRGNYVLVYALMMGKSSVTWLAWVVSSSTGGFCWA